MARCVIKVCRNYSGRLKTSHPVTYHRLPTNAITRFKWIKNIRKSRKDELWKPAKFAVICSDHFLEKDFANKKRRRLDKKAIPTKALFLSSVRSDSDENPDEIKTEELTPGLSLVNSDTNENSETDEDAEEMRFLAEEQLAKERNFTELNKAAPVLSSVNSDTNESSETDEDAEEMKFLAEEQLAKDKNYTTQGLKENSTDFQPSTSEIKTCDNLVDEVKPDPLSFGTDSITDTTIAQQDSSTLPEIKPENTADLAYLDFDSPVEEKLRIDLRRKNDLLKKHALKIESLRRKNQMLTKKVASYKKALETIRKERCVCCLQIWTKKKETNYNLFA